VAFPPHRSRNALDLWLVCPTPAAWGDCRTVAFAYRWNCQWRDPQWTALKRASRAQYARSANCVCNDPAATSRCLRTEVCWRRTVLSAGQVLIESYPW